MNLPRLWGKKKTLAGAGAAVFFLFWRAGGYYAILEECGKM